ncbi:MAG: NAD-dependent epimerase/dehydratase family protein [Actinobacteria bacterium]|nr:NAD-dependent epimerase/dehydratase family protein [Actinomycetota bacterium]
MLKALVTGSNGFIGSTLVEKLLQENYRVKCFVRKTSNLRWLQNMDIDLVYGELTNPESLVNAVSNVDLVFHLAGTTKAKSRAGYIVGNYQSTINLLDACKKYGSDQQKIVYVSSQAAGGPSDDGKPMTEKSMPHPVSIYGMSKLEAEKAVFIFGKNRPVTVIRPPSVYGPKDRDVLAMFKSINRGILPVFGKGKQKLSMVHVHDLVDGIILAAESLRANGQLYYISGDENYEWKTIGKIMAQALNKHPLTLPIPPWIVNMVSYGSIFLSKLSGKPALLNRDKVAEMKQPSWLCSNALAKKELGFQPKFSLLEGFSMTAEWYKKMGWL